MLVGPVHQNHHSTQRQYNKEHCKNDYRHNLEPSAAIAFRSAQHNRLSTLKLAIAFAPEVSIDHRQCPIGYRNTFKAQNLAPTQPLARATLVEPGSPSLPGVTCSADVTAVSFAFLILRHQREYGDNYQQCNCHCNKSDGKHLILPLSSAGAQTSQKRSSASNALPPN
jgi:hypothetical protein